MPTDAPPPQRRLAAVRTYDVAFSVVWSGLLAALRSFDRWEVKEADPREGRVEVASTSALGQLPLGGTLTLSLDELGQTRLEIRFEEPKHTLFAPAAAGRARRIIRRLEQRLGVSARP